MLNVELLREILIAIVSIVVLVKSADYAIGAVSRFAKKIGFSEYFIGLVTVSIGTSIPELTTAIIGSLAARSIQLMATSQLVLGDLIGANILDVTVVLGVMAIVGRHIKVKGKLMQKTMLPIMLLILLPMFLGIDGVFSRIDGFIMLCGFAVYLSRLWKEEKRRGKIKSDILFKQIYRDMIIFVLAVPFILLSAKYLVASAVKLATLLNFPAYLIGLTFVAIGTTLPELTMETRSVIKGHKEIGFGDILGSVVVNISLILGIAALISPILLNIKMFMSGMSFMITSVFIAILFLNKKEISWKEGIGLLLLYLTFIISIAVTAFA